MGIVRVHQSQFKNSSALPEDAVNGADIVMCATNSIDHVFFERWIEPWDASELDQTARDRGQGRQARRPRRRSLQRADPAARRR